MVYTFNWLLSLLFVILCIEGLILTTPSYIQSIVIENSNFTDYLSNSTIADSINIVSNQNLANISFINLAKIFGNLTIANNNNLDFIYFPLLETIGDLNCAQLKSQCYNSLLFINNNEFFDIIMPNLTFIYGNLEIVLNTIYTLNIPKLNGIYGNFIINTNAIQYIYVQSIRFVSLNLMISNNNIIENINLQSLYTIQQNFIIINNKCLINITFTYFK